MKTNVLKNMRKVSMLFLLALIIVPCFTLLFACNDPEPSPQNSLTKQQYSTALISVSNYLLPNQTEKETSSLKLSNKNIMLATSDTMDGYQLETEDFKQSENTQFMARLIKFVSLIAKSENYQPTTNTIGYILKPDPVAMPNFELYLLQRLGYDGTYVNGVFMTKDSKESTTYAETIVFKIKYNFNTNTLEGFELYEEAHNPDLSYQSFIYNGTNIYGLVRSDIPESVTINIHNLCVAEQQKPVTSVNYDFSNEYAQAMA